MDNQEKTWQDYLFIFYRRRAIWLLAFSSVLAAGAVFTFTTRPIYEARTSLLIDTEERMQKEIFDIISPLGQRESKLKNQVEILKSRSLSLSVLEFISRSEYNEVFEKLVSQNLPPERKLEKKIEWLKDNIKIQPIRGTDIIELKTTAPDPHLASFLANAIAQQYYLQSLKFTRGEVSEVRQFLETQLQNIQQELKTSEEALKVYKESKKVAALPDETTELVKQLVEFDGLFNAAQIELEWANKRMEK